MDLMSILKEGHFGRRRAVRRLPCSLIGSYFGTDQTPHLLRYDNISSKGAKVNTLDALVPKTSFKMEIISRNKGVLFLEGRVCWSNKIKDKWYSGVIFEKDFPYNPEEIM